MSWTEKNFPSAMNNLSPYVRRKAIEVANALKKDGYADDHAVPIAIEVARNWAEGIA